MARAVWTVPAEALHGAFLGGVILMFGARLAGGCTSGHGISASLQLTLPGWVFFASVFVSGILTALMLFGKEHARGRPIKQVAARSG